MHIDFLNQRQMITACAWVYLTGINFSGSNLAVDVFYQDSMSDIYTVCTSEVQALCYTSLFEYFPLVMACVVFLKCGLLGCKIEALV